MLELGGVLECRSNWSIYTEEFCLGVNTLTSGRIACEEFVPDVPLTPFERKYHESGHALYRAVIELPRQSVRLKDFT